MRLFAVSKKWLYLVFYLVGQTIVKGCYEFNASDVTVEIQIITNTSFADRMKKEQVLQKLSMQMEIVLLNCVRLLKMSNCADKVEKCKSVCQMALYYEQQSLVFFSELVRSIQKHVRRV